MKKNWSIVNELTSTKQSSLQVKEVETNGSFIGEFMELSEAFNVEYFASMRSMLAEKIPCNEKDSTHLDYLTNQTGVNFQ